MKDRPIIAVIMSTFNGERFLKEQMESILHQEGVVVHLYVRDDGSSDRTREILREYETAQERIHIRAGANVGYGRSFLMMLEEAAGYDWYAFSDQDDYWEPGKLLRAMELLSGTAQDASCTQVSDGKSSACPQTQTVPGECGRTCPQNESGGLSERPPAGKAQLPKLYYSNLMVSDEMLRVHHVTRLEKRRQCLESVTLRRSIAGCTMVFNAALREEAIRGSWSEKAGDFGTRWADDLLTQGHDSFLVSLCYALGGTVICDAHSCIRYRQHSGNAKGVPMGAVPRVCREWRRLWEDRGTEAGMAQALLDGWEGRMDPAQAALLRSIAASGKGWRNRGRLLWSVRFRTGDVRLTILGKVRLLIPR